ncbi:MAG TPA: hypothetical protein VGF55_11930, partial [Gemmataceae bacterium]
MRRFALCLAAGLAGPLAAGPAAAGPLTVKEYLTHPRNTGIDNENTVAAVGGLTFGGQVTGAGDLAGADIVIAGQYNAALLTPWVAAGGVLV